MNLEDLISKYIDGELSHEEDEILRSMIAEDDFAREKFYASVSLHMAFHEDARSVETPESLLQETEDIIMMEILREAPVVMTKTYRKVNIPAMASLIIIFLLITVFRIHDMNVLNFGPLITTNIQQLDNHESDIAGSEPGAANTQDYAYKDPALSDNAELFPASEENSPGRPDNVASGSGSAASAAGGISPGAKPAFSADGDGSSDTEDLASGSVIEADLGSEGIVEPRSLAAEPALFMNKINEKLNDDISFLSKEIKHPAASAHAEIKNLITGSALPFHLEEKNPKELVPTIISSAQAMPAGILPLTVIDNSLNNEIQVSSFFGTDFYRKGINASDNSSVSHFSQSIAYALNETERMGIEVGYTQYSYYANIVSGFSMKTPPTNGALILIPKPSSGEGEFYEASWNIDRTKQMFWGAAFYEATVFDKYGLSFHGRVGAGGSNDGPLGYGRLFLKYEFLSGLFITLGSEGRLFYAAMYSDLSKQSRDLKSTASFIYGLQFKF